MEDVNNPSQSTDAEQPPNPVNHSRPFFYVQPPSQPFLMYQWPTDPFGQYGFSGPAFPFVRPYAAPYQYMQHPGYVVPHAPMQPTDFRRLTPLFPSVTSYDLRFRQHYQQMSVHREMTSSEAQTESGELVSKLIDSLDGLQTCEKSRLNKEPNMMLSSTPALTICSEVEKLDIKDSKLESVTASETTKTELVDWLRPITSSDSAVYESSRGRLEGSVLSDELPLGSSSVHEESHGVHNQGYNRQAEIPGDACSIYDGGKSGTGSTEVQDSGTYVSDINEKSDPSDGKALDQGEQVANLSPVYAEAVEPLAQTTEHDLPYRIHRLPCNKSTTGLVHQEVNPLVYLDSASALLTSKRYSLGGTYPYSYYPQVTQERQSVLSPSLDELSSRDEMFSTDVEDDLMSGHVYVSGGKLAETSSVPTQSHKEHVVEACSICTKTCACCGASLPDEDETTSHPEWYGYLDKHVAQEPSDQDCECEHGEDVEMSGTCESQKTAPRQHISRHVLPICGRKGVKHKARKVQEGVELGELDQGYGRGECGEQLNGGGGKADRAKGKGLKAGMSKSCSDYQRRDNRPAEILDQEGWNSCQVKPRSRPCRPNNGLQEKGRSARRRLSCKAFPHQRPKRNEYDDLEESEFSYCQRGRGSMKRRGTRY